MRAVLIVDVQNDFMPGGALGVTEGDQIVTVVNKVLTSMPVDFMTILTQDWHPDNHSSFQENGGPWPVHCVQNTPGAQLHTDLALLAEDTVVRKGMDVDIDSYSGFFDNERKNKTDLDDILKENNIKDLWVCGLATDYCVKFTVLDGLGLGYNISVITDACRAVNLKPDDGDKALEEMKTAGASLITSKQLPKDPENGKEQGTVPGGKRERGNS